ncbi:two-component system sensor histidine kinase CreC [Opitutaceae bacterium EW11]|nr:two-component system sensor histidine kinase CreC [Opitutaceae bacterium EW11]
MTIRTRIFLVYLVLVGGGLAYLVSWILEGVRPRYLESMEESLVDAANIVASMLEADAVVAGGLDPARLHTLLDAAYRRRLDARVYSIQKTRIDLRIYVVDAGGRVLYDSENGRDEGQDYSRWLDVHRTLDGLYGARATRLDPVDDSSLVIHVAAPIRSDGRIIGAVSLGKPTSAVGELVAVAKRRITWAGVGGGVLIVGMGFAFSVWLTTPIERLTAYARAVRDGKPATLPRLAGREVGDLRRAFEEMREALEGKKYVERYTQALTHEVKAPLSAIRGAAELLSEEMPPDQREKFLQNIRNEANRIQHVVDQLLQLSALEARRRLGPTEPFELRPFVDDLLRSVTATALSRQLRLRIEIPSGAQVTGEKFLVGVAITNLVKNAVEFSPPGGEVSVSAQTERGGTTIVVEDSGPGIPDYAKDRIFERFYSLPRPGSGTKSTGLGLSFVQEIANLHGGWVQVRNREGGGCRAELGLPR